MLTPAAYTSLLQTSGETLTPIPHTHKTLADTQTDPTNSAPAAELADVLSFDYEGQPFCPLEYESDL